MHLEGMLPISVPLSHLHVSITKETGGGNGTTEGWVKMRQVGKRRGEWT